MKIPAYIIAKAERANRLANTVESLNQDIEDWLESHGVETGTAYEVLYDSNIYEYHGMTVDIDALKTLVENM